MKELKYAMNLLLFKRLKVARKQQVFMEPQLNQILVEILKASEIHNNRVAFLNSYN